MTYECSHCEKSVPPSASVCSARAVTDIGGRSTPASGHKDGNLVLTETYWAVQIGVAGRTGCGKSTLMMALYRIVEPCGGRIIIDGLDVSCIGLTDLRGRLALVPQVCTPDSVHPSMTKSNTIVSGGPYLNHLREGPPQMLLCSTLNPL